MTLIDSIEAARAAIADGQRCDSCKGPLVGKVVVVGGMAMLCEDCMSAGEATLKAVQETHDKA